MAKRKIFKASFWNKVFLWVLIIGGLNWLLAFFDFSLIPDNAKWIYLIVGFSAVWVGFKELNGK